MLPNNNKLKYKIISDQNIFKQTTGTKPPYPASNIILKISLQSTAYQLPLIKLFTNNNDLISHLEGHGFATNRSLTSHIISFLGQIKSQELLNNYDKKDYTNKESQIYKSISKLQAKIRDTHKEERNLQNNDNKLKAQFEFKLKLSLIIQNFIADTKKNNYENYKFIIDNLNNIINLIDSYNYPCHGIEFKDQVFKNIEQKNKLYILDPYNHGRITTLDHILRFYLSVNYFKNVCNATENKQKIPTVKKSEIDYIYDIRQKYKSRFSFNTILGYILNYKLRSIYFFSFVVLEIALLPFIRAALKNYYLIHLMGLTNPIVLLTFMIPLTLTIINRIAELPNMLSKTFKKISGLLLKTKDGNSTDNKSNPRSKLEKLYAALLSHSQTTTKEKKEKNKSKNIILRIPIISTVFKFLNNQYKNYCNWSFSYIQRNPIAFLLYIVLKTAALFLQVLYIPLSNWLFKTYIDIDRSIDQERTLSKDGIAIPQSEINDIANEKLKYKAKIKSRSSGIQKQGSIKNKLTQILRYSTDALKLITLKLPIGALYLTSKIILSGLYILSYLIITTATQAMRIIDYNNVYKALVDIESKLTGMYIENYYTYQYYFSKFNFYIDTLNPIGFLQNPSSEPKITSSEVNKKLIVSTDNLIYTDSQKPLKEYSKQLEAINKTPPHNSRLASLRN